MKQMMYYLKLAALSFTLMLVVGGDGVAAKIQKGKKPSNAAANGSFLGEDLPEKEPGLLFKKRQRVCNSCSHPAPVDKSGKRAVSSAMDDLQLPLPCESIGTSDPNDLKREVAWGELVVDEGPFCIEMVHDVKVVETTEDGRGEVELETIPVGDPGYVDTSITCPSPFVNNGFSCTIPPANPDNCPDIIPAGSRVKLREQRFQQNFGCFHFDPQNDALLIRFNDTMLRSPGAHLKLTFLSTAAANPTPVADLWNKYYAQVNNHVTTKLPDLVTTGEWKPLDTYPSYTVADIDCNWYPIEFDTKLFLHPQMRGDLSKAPFLAAPAVDDMNDHYFHLINAVEESIYSDTVFAFLTPWGLPDVTGGTYNPCDFTAFATPLVGRTKQTSMRFKDTLTKARSLVKAGMYCSLSDLFLAPPMELNVGFQKCGDTGIKLNIFPRWDSYTGLGGLDDNGKTFYTKPSKSVLKIDPGILCYELCSGNLGDCLPSVTGEFCGGFIKNPSLVNIMKCESSILDCLCAFNLDESLLTAIVELIEDILKTSSATGKGKQLGEKQRALQRVFHNIGNKETREAVYRALVMNVKSRGIELDEEL